MEREKIVEAIEKRAVGFFYEEESLEFESFGGNSKFLFCKKKSRLYMKKGFLKVHPRKIFASSSSLSLPLLKRVSGFGIPSKFLNLRHTKLIFQNLRLQ